jgi:hypothetical protein
MSPVFIEEDYSDFDWDSTEDGAPQYPPLPAGWYPVRIAKAELKTVEGKAGPFQKLALKLAVLEGNPHAGRIVFDDVIMNSKEGSKRRRAIIWRRLGLVAKGAQRAAISEDDLVGRECAVEVKVVDYPKRDGTKGTKNEVTFAGYRALGDLEAGEAPQAAGPGERLSETSCPF